MNRLRPARAQILHGALSLLGASIILAGLPGIGEALPGTQSPPQSSNLGLC